MKKRIAALFELKLQVVQVGFVAAFDQHLDAGLTKRQTGREAVVRDFDHGGRVG